ncbi:MAG TPA: NAD-binding protein, partial [Pseudomonadales bacterium]|nr:NAD-binding protein [Pseudomonadales bacterium]
MNMVLFLILRRMRAPLLALSLVYSVATLGLTIIPGMDDQGNPWHMDFFHAFYFVSFMGTTIGFGEIPYPFTDAQRLWALVFIYITVATWIYAIGTVLSLLQNETLRRAGTEYQFRQSVRSLREPFFVICGYGDSGGRLVDSLERRNIHAVVVEIRQERIDALILGDYTMQIPRLCGDASDPQNLILAGIESPFCAGVVALTDQNQVNLHIAITSRVLNPDAKVICRAEAHYIEANMASFGTDCIIDPFDTFAQRLSLALDNPCLFLLDSMLRDNPGWSTLEAANVAEGRWVLCGYGRLGEAIHKIFAKKGVDVTVVEPYLDRVGGLANYVIGLGTEAHTLNEANIAGAVGVVAGTDNDSNNLSIIVTAKEINPDLFTVVRQSNHFNRRLFEKAEVNIVMASSTVVASKIKTLLVNPMVDDFLSLAHAQSEEWADALNHRLNDLTPDDRPPVIWELSIIE